MAIEITPVSGSAKFPRAYRYIKDGDVVLFTDSCAGMVIVRGGSRGSNKVGYQSDGWAHCTDRTLWEPVNLTITHD